MAAEHEINIKFVQEIEKYPCLYNFNLPDYMRKHTTEKTWEEIGKKYQLTGPACKERWKNLRSVFVRHLKPPKSGTTTAQKKPYYLSKYMQFAIPFIKIPGNVTGASEATSVNDENSSLSTQFATENSFTSFPSILQQQSSLTSASSPSILPQQSSFPSTSSVSQSQSRQHLIQQQQPKSSKPTSTKKKNRRKFEETHAVHDIAAYLRIKQAKMLENCDSGENSNKMFLLSLLSDMNKMNDRQRRVFKRKVLEVVDEIMEISMTGGSE